jgi:hypothetical protein
MDKKKGADIAKSALKKIANPIKPIQPKKNSNICLLLLICLGCKFSSKFMNIYIFFIMITYGYHIK